MELPLTEPGWAWGRNKEMQRPYAITLTATTLSQAPEGEPRAPGIMLSVYSKRGREQGSSPIDLHLNNDDAKALAEAILGLVSETDSDREARLVAEGDAITEAWYDEHGG
jgi:hypothetical protein